MKYAFTIFLFFVLGFACTTGYSQINLVRNPSFELVNQPNLLCNFYQTSISFDNAIVNWTTPTTGTSDIYHMSLNRQCVLHPLSTSNSNLGNRAPRTGDSMVGLLLYSPNSKREYIQGELNEPLQAGHRYSITFYVSLALKSQFASNNFGVKFYDEYFFQNSNDVIDVVPDANHPLIITQRFGWVLVELEYTPQTSGANYFILGNFFNDEQTLLEQDPTAEDEVMRAYYYIDDVAITRKTATFEVIDSLCQGTTIELPKQSKEGYTGTWSPAPNNQETTTYTFTADDPTVDAATLTIEIIKPYIEPLFTLTTTQCEGTIVALPTTSENGYTGTWSPEFNPTTTTTYTFTPDEGFCVLPKTIDIVITPKIEPQFELPAFICPGELLDELPLVSANGIAGTWTPALNLQQTTTYTFTPLEGYCAHAASVTIEVKHPKTPRLEYYCAKDQLYIEAQPNSFSPASSFHWSINQVEVEENSPKVSLSTYRHLLREDDNTVVLTTRDEYGCSASTTLELYGAKNLCFIPRGISPQGDQLNDAFDLENFGGVSLQLFNRYGQRVYHKKNYTKQWEGQSDGGKLLPSGTYFYHILTAKNEEFTGWVQLMREF